ncbi:MAG TPA: PDZ domain-containing protein [Nocardioidaceae bacterium]|jgi:PDZ domain-containing protein
MTRRTITLLGAGVVLGALLLVAFFAPMPYVVMSPGLTENTLGSFDGKQVITIDGHKTYPTSGRLDLTTVSVTSPDYSPRLSEILQAWWDKDEIVIPRDVAYPPSQSVEQVQQQNRTDMLDSQQSAIAAGLGEAGIPSVYVTVSDVEKDAPANGVLKTGDLITSVDGTTIHSVDAAISGISSVEPGSDVTLGIKRNDKDEQVTITTEASEDDPSKARIGVGLGETIDPPFTVKINLGQNIGGPSAGTMFALAIYDMITPGPLTGGRHVAGTGTITPEGRVGVIGGVQQKIAGAYREGATVFLVPAGDCAEAAKSPLADDIQLVKVETLDQAVNALEGIDSGDTSAVTPCTTG